MNTPTLGNPRFSSKKSHTISDDVRVPERIEIGADPGLEFELAGPRAKLFFDGKKTRAGVVTCGGLCPGLNNVIRSLFLELHYGYGRYAPTRRSLDMRARHNWAGHGATNL